MKTCWIRIMVAFHFISLPCRVANPIYITNKQRKRKEEAAQAMPWIGKHYYPTSAEHKGSNKLTKLPIETSRITTRLQRLHILIIHQGPMYSSTEQKLPSIKLRIHTPCCSVFHHYVLSYSDLHSTHISYANHLHLLPSYSICRYLYASSRLFTPLDLVPSLQTIL